MTRKYFYTLLIVSGILISACTSSAAPLALSAKQPLSLYAATAIPASAATPLPQRPEYKPGELVDYTAQTGDTLPALAARFNTTIDKIMAANPIIPADATTMPPGFPMKIPVYFKSLWANPFKVMPDSAFVNGPSLIGFNTSAFVAAQPGWFKDYGAYAGEANRTGAQIVDYVAENWSVSPRLLLAVLEYQAGVLSQPEPDSKRYLLGYKEAYYEAPYLQLVWAANILNNGYYGWRAGKLTEFDLPDGTLIRPDPWQNAASVGIQYYFSRTLSGSAYERAVGPEGLAKTYASLFGDPWADPSVLIPGSLKQPTLRLPFPDGQTWTYTGGPHTGWGKGEPWAAIDFAPPTEFSGCFQPDPQEFSIAMANGMVVRSETGVVVLDLDGDGNERTGWDLVYVHVGAEGRPPIGAVLKTGDFVGYPSCEGGRATGNNVHIIRKYNGEWIRADSPIPFDLDGWVPHDGNREYTGTLTRNGFLVKACDCSDSASRIQSDFNR